MENYGKCELIQPAAKVEKKKIQVSILEREREREREREIIL